MIANKQLPVATYEGAIVVSGPSPYNVDYATAPTTIMASPPTLMLAAKSTSRSVLVLQAKASQSADIFQAQNSSGTVLVSVSATGVVSAPGSGSTSERFGASSVASALRSCAFGNSASASGNNSIAIGQAATASDGDAVAIGFTATAAGDGSTAVGGGATVGATHQGSIAIGETATTTAARQFVAGGAGNYRIDDVYFGKGVTSTGPTSYTIHGTGGSGTDVAGGDIVVAGGRGTGTGIGGSILFQTAPAAGLSGNVLNNLSTVVTILSTGLTGFGNSPTAVVDVGASTTSHASLRIRSGTAPTSPNDGDIWFDSTRKAMARSLNGLTVVDASVLFVQTANAGPNNSNAEVSLLGTGNGTKTLPANWFVAGKALRIYVRGFYSTKNGGTGTITIRVKLGSTTIVTTGAITPSANQSNQGFEVTTSIMCRTTGASGTVFGQGSCYLFTNAAGATVGQMTNSATTVIDTTASQVLDVTAQFSTADASNIMTASNADIFIAS